MEHLISVTQASAGHKEPTVFRVRNIQLPDRRSPPNMIEPYRRALEYIKFRFLRRPLVHAEDGVLVGIEGYRTAMGFEVALQRLKVGVRALTGHEAQLHQLTSGIVDEYQQSATLHPAAKPKEAFVRDETKGIEKVLLFSS